MIDFNFSLRGPFFAVSLALLSVIPISTKILIKSTLPLISEL